MKHEVSCRQSLQSAAPDGYLTLSAPFSARSQLISNLRRVASPWRHEEVLDIGYCAKPSLSPFPNSQRESFFRVAATSRKIPHSKARIADYSAKSLDCLAEKSALPAKHGVCLKGLGLHLYLPHT